MAYFQTIPEARFRLGNEVVFLNPLHCVEDLHRDEGSPAYVDSDRRFRISGYSVLYRPQWVQGELMRLGGDRWSADEVAAVIEGASTYLRQKLAAAGLTV